MRTRWMLAGLLIGAASISGVALSQTDDASIKPLSRQLAQSGQQLLAQGKAQAAVDQFETALAVDPRNAAAFLGLAKANEKLELPGKAVKYYREALSLDPNDLAALEGQGGAFVARGATARAQVNLARIRQLCETDCAAAKRLSAVIAAGPPKVQTAASTSKPAAPATDKN